MKFSKPYRLTFYLLLSCLFFTFVGGYWNQEYYHKAGTLSMKDSPVALAMMGLHDGLLLPSSATQETGAEPAAPTETQPSAVTDIAEAADSETVTAITAPAEVKPVIPTAYSFTTAADDYFNDAVFIGDSRTVGISEYAGIDNAVFLCRTSLTIYDYDKPKITYNDKKTSIKDILTTEQFGKIYLMLGINESSYGSADSFYESYRAVVEDIRALQPHALIFLQGNLFVTKAKSDAGNGITNERIAGRNERIASLADDKNIFYIDINESSLCENGALVSQYTWDQVHIKAQYYSLWKEYLLKHAIIKG